jgi:hypothetical protein
MMATKNVNGIIVEMSADEIYTLSQAFTPAQVEVLLATDARAERNTLLAASDWTQIPDAPVDQAAWATYRQALRDITAQAGFPADINWPVVLE